METLLAVVLLALPAAVSAQRSVAAYTKAQRAALQGFLSRNPSLQFIPETWFDAETLRYARREWGFGRAFTPYYQRGDMNGDGDMDFASVLLDSNRRTLFVVAFLQIPGQTYRAVHIQPVGRFNDALFIQRTGGRLHYGVMESDECGEFAPAGRGFIVQACS